MINESDLGEAPLETLVLRVVWDDQVSTFSLATTGIVSVGRGPEAGVQVPFHTASRRHALIRITSPLAVQVCDLGSANGTFVRGTRLEPNVWTDVDLREAFGVAEAMVVIQPGAVSQDCTRIVGADMLSDHLRAELIAHRNSRQQLGVCVLECKGPIEKAVDGLVGFLSPDDVLGLLNKSTIAVVLTRRDPEAVARLASELEMYMQRRGARPMSRVTLYPHDGTTAEQLLPELSPPEPPPRTCETMRAAAPRERSPEMKKIYSMVEHIAPTLTSVLIFGATGTGKELLARRLHELSDRASGPMIALNCAALPENLLESELFGYERGAFTGALVAKPGQFELANGGTLFLDEVGDMPVLAQAKLLRVLEERAVMRLGAVKLKPVDVRIIAATNRDLHALIASGQFRADLFYRLNGFSLTLPLLRERRHSIVPLALHFVERAAVMFEKPIPTVAPKVLDALMEYPWPGNIRELRVVVERAVLLCHKGRVQLEHLPDTLFAGAPPETKRWIEDATDVEPALRLPDFAQADWEANTLVRPIPAALLPSVPLIDIPSAPISTLTATAPASASASATPLPATTRIDDVVDAIHKYGVGARGDLLTEGLVAGALERCGGNQTEAAKLLRISRRTLISRIERFGLSRPRKGK